jgi:hypothetical protein
MTTPVAPHSLQELLTPQQLTDLRIQLLSFLQGQGLPALSEWSEEPDGLEMSFVDMIVKAICDLAQSGAPLDSQIASVAASRFLGYARGGWLDLLSWSVYRLTRNPTTKTTFALTLKSVEAAPPYSFEVGDVRVVGPTGNEYQSTSAGDLPPDGQVEIAFAAVDVGSAYDDDPSAPGVTLQLATAYAGVSISTSVGDFTIVSSTGGSTGRLDPARTDPAVAPPPRTYSIRIDTAGDPGSATYSLLGDDGQYAFQGLLNASNALPGGTTVGAVAGSSPSFLAGDTFVFSTPGSSDYIQGDDLETDAALAQRCRLRWPSLALNVLDAKAILSAVTAYPSANRIQISPSRVTPGWFVVTVADSHGGVDQVALNTIASYVRSRLGVGEGMTAASAASAEILVQGNTRVPPGTSAEGLAAIQAAANTAWIAYLATVPIGPSEIFISKLIQILMDAGCEDVGDVSPIAFSLYQIPAGAVPVAGNDLISALTWMGP